LAAEQHQMKWKSVRTRARPKRVELTLAASLRSLLGERTNRGKWIQQW
jgi:hypothetical protein